MGKMSEISFEKSWESKFSNSLDKIAGEKIRKRVLEGNEKLTSTSSQKEIIRWTKKAMERLDALVDEKRRREIMAGCACRYPETDLHDIRKRYGETGDIDLAHAMLQKKFVAFLKNSLWLSNELIEEIVSRGWGSAGVKKENTIIATKIPKTGHLVEYMKEKDRKRKRALYCHCPRIRDSIESKTKISPTYCYCGAGFYKGIWECLLRRPVRVEVLESLLLGGDVCRIAIHLPPAK
jgi:predicted hydrocarbon binding protein